MQVNNLKELKKSINQSSWVAFFVFFSLSLVVLFIIDYRFYLKQDAFNDQEIIYAENLYKSNLSEKLSMLANSPAFLDYLRSGSETRKKLYTQFLLQLSSLKSNIITGMIISDANDKEVFHFGESSSRYVDLKLCYLNQTLDPEMGSCDFVWKIYFGKEDLSSDFLAVNPKIKKCIDCKRYDFFNGKNFGSFPVLHASKFNNKLEMNSNDGSIFLSYFLLLMIALFLFSAWNWHRLGSIINKYIANPIDNLTQCLKLNEKNVSAQNHIQEIEFLINEINAWKYKLNKITANEHATKLAKIAAQLVHDMRSPLAAIDMIVNNLAGIAENYKRILSQSCRRISDIASNFLVQYKMPTTIAMESKKDHEIIFHLTKDIFAEKITQYLGHPIKLKIITDRLVQCLSCYINGNDYKRVLSNLIDNAVESMPNGGIVSIYLKKNNEMIIIEIVDNGCGIDEALLPEIISCGLSMGKKGGSGLGLSHAIARVKEWHGRFDIISKIGRGTKVTIELPLSKNE